MALFHGPVVFQPPMVPKVGGGNPVEGRSFLNKLHGILNKIRTNFEAMPLNVCVCTLVTQKTQVSGRMGLFVSLKKLQKKVAVLLMEQL